jgi:hypothetical protein
VSERVLQLLTSLGLLGLGLYFAVQIVRGLAGYRRFLRVKTTALVTWPGPRPAQLPLLLAMGVAGAVVAALNAWQRRPVHHVIGLALMAAYFLGLVPLARRIRLGIYRDGVWAHRGFLRWEDVARIAFVETPQVVLLLRSRRDQASFKLLVPGEEYGTVRKLLDEKARAGVLRLDPAILDLS